MKKISLFIFVFLSSLLSAQIVDEYPFEDVYELCGDETIELNTPDIQTTATNLHFRVIFCMSGYLVELI